MRKLLAALVMMFGLLSAAFAAVDANTADVKQLETVKGIGPKIAADIVSERTKNGAFKSTDDLKKRVKGIGDKKIAEFVKQGLTVGSAPVAAPAKPVVTTKPAATTGDPKKPAVK
jgi:competence protein ComEA